MSAASSLRRRLWPWLSIAGAAGCANKATPTSDVPPSPTSAAVATSTAGSATSAPTSTATTTPTTTPTAKLARCRACNLHCYAHAAGETCLPADAGAALDARVGCEVYDKSGPHDDGKQCCYGGPCPGRPLSTEGQPLLAPLVRSDVSFAWA